MKLDRWSVYSVIINEVLGIYYGILIGYEMDCDIYYDFIVLGITQREKKAKNNC